ncbi:diguanylate cyclase [Acidovorax sp. SRB_14]|uniref:diguanylate cyclase n=1 Tax=Acidovorax sp. SRB_14 TaxID=1962699 RepID=UPI001564D17E|nr:diguanylate cyclase [Acidovorax sp. SRB_14]NMM81045.1 diguanylate cyclase [Acidovorax sp. SRB_14]
MSSHTDEQHAAEWRQLLHRHGEPVRQQVRALAAAHRQALASHFYAQMMGDTAASAFLSHEQVHSRLHACMQAWVVGVFALEPEDDLVPVVAQQNKIGEIHARIDVPVHLVLRGARSLKEKMHALLQDGPAPDGAARVEAMQLVAQVVDLTMEIMSQAYSSSRDRNSRAKEAYRLFAVAQNVSTERERRRAALLDWENQLMFDHAVGLQSVQLPRLAASEFGLWFRHKGTHVFQGTQETEAILRTMQHIDEALLPAFAQAGDGADERIARLRELREHSKRIAFQLDALFEQNSELEAGRDVLTRLLNRKFLPVVLGKEVNYARDSGSSFAVLAIDIDHFKRINDGHGHEAGDMVLQQMAAVLSHHTRGGDYLFRLGGEEFLLLLVDTPLAGAQRAAQKLCQQVAAEAFQLPRDQTLQVTVSIGVAAFNGHPDYQSLLRRADAALYQAKNAGRNGVAAAD